MTSECGCAAVPGFESETVGLSGAGAADLDGREGAPAGAHPITRPLETTYGFWFAAGFTAGLPDTFMV
jgi:hypothetical protein